jgi:hypothetical protein
MCIGKKPPKMDIPDPAPLQQAAKEPDIPLTRKKNKGAFTAPGSTLLTGTEGVETASQNLGSASLLGSA